MHLHEAFNEIKRLRESFNAARRELRFEDEMHFENRPVAECLREEAPFADARRKNGVYFILDDDETVLYIGMAARRNLYSEMRRRLFIRPAVSMHETPAETNPFISKAVESRRVKTSYKRKLLEGSLRAAYVTIKPSEMVCLVHSHLLAYCKKIDSALPRFNDAEDAPIYNSHNY